MKKVIGQFFILTVATLAYSLEAYSQINASPEICQQQIYRAATMISEINKLDSYNCQDKCIRLELSQEIKQAFEKAALCLTAIGNYEKANQLYSDLAKLNTLSKRQA